MASKGRITDSFPQRKTRSASASASLKKAQKPYAKVKPVKQNKPDVPKPSTSQKLLEEDLQLLKEFDLNWEYGPCMGITRMERWRRADKHGQNPPEEVKDLVEKHKDDEVYTECLWHDYNIL